MKIDRAGLPFILGSLFPAAALVALRQPAWALPLVSLSGFFAFFFRDPDRNVPDDPTVVVSPADGRVMHAGAADPEVAPEGDWAQISIFLSPLDVHVNRTPVSGRILQVDYRPGRFLPAYRGEAAVENERSEIWIDHAGRTVVCRQVVGLLARRVVCRLVPGMDVRQGQRLGIMKFGSRMDVFLPSDSVFEVDVGDTVRGGETIVSRLIPSGQPDPNEDTS
jgi:phosphatidylserine decarboxylase